MIDPAETDLDQIESAYLKLNILARSLKACLEGLAEPEASDRIGGAESLANRFVISNL